ncbi:Dipeptide transport system permease protein DppB [Desulfosporosinus sp. I2]|uniref:ABC transporter permease n=1 Tax=Desulfosporosinus sp. I2 TaxID=1617025 RepID=UPI0005F01EF0|nr:ABC transporter permease [Desulfosporosinus sp. I2]KJR47151.1 Dipeptide transport system permease protein DppB [Desulfosporosinus sp. I2]
MGQLSYILKRILQIIPVLIVVTILIFFMIRLIPGDPATVILGDKATPDLIVEINKRLGLDKPLYVQYFLFLKALVRLDLGNSILYVVPVSQLLGKRMVVTLSLTLLSALFAVIVSFPLGYIAGFHKDKLPDQIIRTGSLVALSMPAFWVGMLLLLGFGLKLHWFPVGGWGETWPEHLRSLVLPAITQSLLTAALLVKNLRNNVVDVMRMDYVDFARSKGLSERTVISRHVIRNALISTVTLLAMQMAYMLGGSVIIETVFALPGVGSLMVQAIFSRDYAVVQAVVFLFAALVLLINLLTDVSYSFLDPRVKLE